ncbi:MAG: nucleotidyltransferase family protein [Chitinophagaceae bacterium]|nr:nucleotidyltransferase family protein [Chitinophagaceae bacterium]
MEQNIKEAIILAGGLGTRLRSAVPDLPKCMAPVNGRPFITWVTDHFKEQGVEHFVFALGYKNEAFLELLDRYFPAGNYSISVEDEPLGTGGAIQLACSKIKTNQAVVANGDTLFRVNMKEVAAFHFHKKATCTLALKPMKHFSRYGAVETDTGGRIRNFREKQYLSEGLINGGVYALDKNLFLSKKLPLQFSFEKDFLEKFYRQGNVYGIVQDVYFIDIGIPEDYARAQEELKLLL